MEQLDYNLLYRWFVGLAPDDQFWDQTTLTKNRTRLENGELFAKFTAKLLNCPEVRPLLSSEALFGRWDADRGLGLTRAFGRRMSDDDGANFHGQMRKNYTHASVTDPDSQLYRKAAGGSEARLHGACHCGEPEWPAARYVVASPTPDVARHSSQ